MSTHRKRPLGRVCLMALALAALFLLSFVWGRYDVPLARWCASCCPACSPSPRRGRTIWPSPSTTSACPAS